MRSMPYSAVITGDIVGSTGLEKGAFKKLLRQLETVLSTHTVEFYRGDSFQIYVKEASAALRLVLRMRVEAIRLSAVAAPASDVRASIGIGYVKPPVKILRTATDEAFVLSGRAFDALKTPQRLRILASDTFPVVNTGLQVISDFVDYILQKMTVKQAAVVAELLQGRTQTEAAKHLRKSQATINKHAQAAGWPQLENVLQSYQQLIANLTL